MVARGKPAPPPMDEESSLNSETTMVTKSIAKVKFKFNCFVLFVLTGCIV